MSVLEYSYQPSLNIDEVNRQVSALVDACKTALLDCASSQAVEEVSLKAEQNGEQAARRVAEISARVNETSSKVNLLATYDTAQGTISVSAALVNGIAQSNIVLSGDHIILDGNVNIGSGFYLSGDHITANTITSTQIATATITANEIAGNTITAAEIASGAIHSDEIYSGAITADKIATGAITADKIDAGAVTANKIAAGAISADKIGAGNLDIGNNYFTFGPAGEKRKIWSSETEIDGTWYNTVFAQPNLATGRVFCDKINMATPSSSSSTTANMRISDTGWVCKMGGSSKRFKHDIKPIEENLDIHKLYDIPVIQFVYNSDYLEKGDQRQEKAVPGFIAEDIQEIYPIACDLEADGKAHDWNERFIIPPMLALIQEQNKRIERLEALYGDN